MNIHINNYEAFFIDYLEGTLSSELVQELNSFLRIHPELKVELEDFAFIPLYDNQIKFENKFLPKNWDL